MACGAEPVLVGKKKKKGNKNPDDKRLHIYCRYWKTEEQESPRLKTPTTHEIVTNCNIMTSGKFGPRGRDVGHFLKTNIHFQFLIFQIDTLICVMSLKGTVPFTTAF